MRCLAIDQGTTSTRGILVAADGRAEPVASLAHRQILPRRGWVEHDPEELLANVAAALAAGAARGATSWALANQGESCLAWDATSGAAISPVIVWQDARTAEVTDALQRDGAAAEVAARAGLPLDPYFSASKLGWILRHVPQARALLASGRLRLGTTDAFFRDRLTGRFETDPATASRTSLMNLASCRWDPELCRIFGVPIEALPRIVPCAGALGTAEGLPLAASIVDQQAALFGHGCRAPGDTKITFGTGAFVLAVAGAAPPAPGLGALPTVAWQQDGAAPVYALDGGVYAASAALNWARDLGLFSGFDEISGLGGSSMLARGLVFVPALVGLACPHWDRGATGAWLGLTLETGRQNMVQAILEGVAYRTAEVLEAMGRCTAIRSPIAIDGGMSQNPGFARILANVCRRSVVVSDQAERTALGLAALADEAQGQVLPLPQGGQRVDPDPGYPDLHDAFARARDIARIRLV
ncbi:FGGY family carbohydrate kinase [Tropicimonas sp. IMCC34043]|uniref:FGGY family carbohydrate kinase n=1 Tax=Tropicimonas sp. IMCC34043 TaxID=2248760 RepID=UPI000E262143|nr:FGGY family carbohydrate kinase [Tropicimonas sp. IMCC34043]